MLILGLNKTTLLDYPERVAATVFLGGCNFRCPYCHNGDLVLNYSSMPAYTQEDIITFLSKRKNVLEGVCISGGEPALNADLPDFLRKIKGLGYSIKLDTNGSNPDMLRLLISERLIDYCAMDIKNSPDKYFDTVGLPISIDKIMSSVDLLLSNGDSSFLYEFRTTIVKELHTENDIVLMSKWLTGARAYFLQSYVESDGVISKGFHPHSEETIYAFAALCRKYVPNTQVRGI